MCLIILVTPYAQDVKALLVTISGHTVSSHGGYRVGFDLLRERWIFLLLGRSKTGKRKIEFREKREAEEEEESREFNFRGIKKKKKIPCTCRIREFLRVFFPKST